jgi:UDP-N-acetylmuramoyl-tripeptide--D-alanyl-D-alanine ligase
MNAQRRDACGRRRLDAMTGWPQRPVSGRRSGPRLTGARLIDDFTPISAMRAACTRRRSRRALAGLGEMRAGRDSAQLHADQEFARQRGVTRLLAVGEDARHAVEAYGPGASWFAGVEDLIVAAKAALGNGVTVLIKGSRANRLERVADALAVDGTVSRGGSH